MIIEVFGTTKSLPLFPFCSLALNRKDIERKGY